MAGILFSEDQITKIVSKNVVDFADFVDEISTNVSDERVLIYINRLLVRIFELSQSDKYMTKTQACRMIPAEHAETCKKYVDEASRLGFIDFEPDAADKRKIIVKPTSAFIDYARKRATESLKEIAEILNS